MGKIEFGKTKMDVQKACHAKGGQALVEYILVIFFIAAVISVFYGYLPRMMSRLQQPMKSKLKYAYQYGDPEACGFEDQDPPCTGTPKRHPRIYAPENFRMFGRLR